MFEAEGLNIDLRVFHSQFDADTAILGTTAQGGVTDIARVMLYATQQKPLKITSLLGGSWMLMGSSEKNIHTTKQLKGKTLAIARHSASETYSSVSTSAAQLQHEDVLLPQINDYALRANMLNANQVDAAILPEPYATVCRIEGQHVLDTYNNGKANIGCLAFKSSFLRDTINANQVKKILTVYNKAIASLSTNDDASRRSFLEKVCLLPTSIADSLGKIHYFEATLPDHAHFQRAGKCLKKNIEKISFEELVNYHTLPQ